MGMSASQARFLGLTARKNNVEFEGQQINQQRTTLSDTSSAYYSELCCLEVPTPPSIDDYTKVSYTFLDGSMTNTVTAMLAKGGDEYSISYIQQWQDDYSIVSSASSVITKTTAIKTSSSVTASEQVASAEEASEEAEEQKNILSSQNSVQTSKQSIENIGSYEKCSQDEIDYLDYYDYHTDGTYTQYYKDDDTNSFYYLDSNNNAVYNSAKDQTNLTMALREDDGTIVLVSYDEDTNAYYKTNIAAEETAPDGTGTTTETGTTDTTDSTDGTGKTDGTDSTDGTGTTDGTDSTDGTGKTDGTDSTDGTGKTGGTDSTDGTGKTDGTDSTDGTGKTDGTDSTDGTGKTEGTDSTDGTGKTDGTGTTTGGTTTATTNPFESEERSYKIGSVYLRTLGNVSGSTSDSYLSTLDYSQLKSLAEEEEYYKALLNSSLYNGQNTEWYVRYAKDSSTNTWTPYFYKKSDVINGSYTNGISANDIKCYTLGSTTKTKEVINQAGNIEKDSTGRYISIMLYNTDANGNKLDADGNIASKSGKSAVYTTYNLTTNTSTDEDAYNDAMNNYNYKQYQYEQRIQDINSKIEIVQQQDKALELQLKHLDTEESAITNELEAVKKVISKNIDSSFKTFSA